MSGDLLQDDSQRFYCTVKKYFLNLKVKSTDDTSTDV